MARSVGKQFTKMSNRLANNKMKRRLSCGTPLSIRPQTSNSLNLCQTVCCGKCNPYTHRERYGHSLPETVAISFINDVTDVDWCYSAL